MNILKHRKNLLLDWILFSLKLAFPYFLAFRAIRRRRELGCVDFHALQSLVFAGPLILFLAVSMRLIFPTNARGNVVLMFSVFYVLCCIATVIILERQPKPVKM